MLQDVLFGAKRRFDEKFAAKAPVTHRGDPAGAEVVAIHVGPGRVVSVQLDAGACQRLAARDAAHFLLLAKVLLPEAQQHPTKPGI